MLCVCVCGHCAYDTQTSPGHWPKMTLYRVDECVVYAVTDMVRYHPGWAAPLMFESSLLKGMIKHHTSPITLEGALDKYGICFFVSNSVETYEINQCQTFQLILPMRFHFMRSFMNSIISRVSHRLLCSVFIEVDFEKLKMLEMLILLQK